MEDVNFYALSFPQCQKKNFRKIIFQNIMASLQLRTMKEENRERLPRILPCSLGGLFELYCTTSLSGNQVAACKCVLV